MDYLGKIIGESRLGRDDEDYRAALRVRVSINTATGTPDSVIDLVKGYTNSETVRLREGSIAWANLYLDGDINLDRTLYQMVQDIKPAATKWIINTDIEKNALDLVWEEAVTEALLANVSAECGDFSVQCGEEVAQCGNSLLKTVTTTSRGIYPPSLNENNSFAWEVEQITVAAQCGEPHMQCGEQGAECGNNFLFTTTDVERPLRWEVQVNSLPLI